MAENIDAERAAPALLPCPWCGGAARIESNRDWHRLYAAHDDECVRDADEPDLMYPAKPEYLTQIAEDWNRRTPSASTGEDGLPEPTAPKGPFADYSAEEVAAYARQYAREALQARWCAEVDADRLREGIADLRAALQCIHDTFKRDLDQGYRTRDKEFAVSIAESALAAPPLSSEQQAKPRRTPLESFAIRMSGFDPHPDEPASVLAESIREDAAAVLAASEQQAEKGEPNVG